MSRSIRKRPFWSVFGSRSMKSWRTQENKRLRHNSKQIINTCEDYDAMIIPVLNDYDTLWGSPQDGRKRYREKPLLNQCEWDDSTYSHRWGFTRYTIKKGGHHSCCNCYGNKRTGWWWKLLGK